MLFSRKYITQPTHNNTFSEKPTQYKTFSKKVHCPTSTTLLFLPRECNTQPIPTTCFFLAADPYTPAGLVEDHVPWLRDDLVHLSCVVLHQQGPDGIRVAGQVLAHVQDDADRLVLWPGENKESDSIPTNNAGVHL